MTEDELRVLVRTAIARVRTGAAVVHLVGQHVLLEILGWIEHGPRLEESDANAEVCEDFNGSAATGAGADNYNVENLRTTLHLEHV